MMPSTKHFSNLLSAVSCEDDPWILDGLGDLDGICQVNRHEFVWDNSSVGEDESLQGMSSAESVASHDRESPKPEKLDTGSTKARESLPETKAEMKDEQQFKVIAENVPSAALLIKYLKRSNDDIFGWSGRGKIKN